MCSVVRSTVAKRLSRLQKIMAKDPTYPIVAGHTDGPAELETLNLLLEHTSPVVCSEMTTLPITQGTLVENP